MKAFLLTTLHVIRDGVVARTLAIGLPPSAASDSRKGPEGAVAVLVILIGRVAVRLHRHCPPSTISPSLHFSRRCRWIAPVKPSTTLERHHRSISGRLVGI
ncbi:hypothetical protein SAMN05216228_101356 [Rhizobium tibeticum]|uniref:Uncharacterized protein n=1 Tax=Rhizobium tibeticum TaxID=501024 RepID=A0A1H8MTI8_9HYPH|nr:hypothetical protein [Rhizobium tibeticum]SEI11567.1 hypothetical protein RTCCBAU85039_4686 [Rhizobium tibeticum]SEO20667.1 hypothetical protein SAMN05216228_101356 [Rhizobium tibeticum]